MNRACSDSSSTNKRCKWQDSIHCCKDPTGLHNWFLHNASKDTMKWIHRKDEEQIPWRWNNCQLSQNFIRKSNQSRPFQRVFYSENLFNFHCWGVIQFKLEITLVITFFWVPGKSYTTSSLLNFGVFKDSRQWFRAMHGVTGSHFLPLYNWRE